MDEKDLPSSSDESDVDFVPKEGDNSDTGSEVSDDEISEGEDNKHRGRKRKKKNKNFEKKTKRNENEEEREDNEIEEKKEIDVDALWADFKKDVNNQETKKTAETSNTTSEVEGVDKKSNPSTAPLNSSIINQRKALKLPTHCKAGGLSKVLNQIGKKDKMSTLQKSQLDWNKFKKSEGIEEEIKTFNRGKDGYLDKQDFLQRTDMRQFEIEKELRCTRRKF